ncbi:hypothetical protein ERO13_D02G097701v2 [Gossypium hirsutum]|nr:hypothetical protein ERO13_D02G097701v2 [Gossypium hirsutum]
MDWIESQLDYESIFPQKLGAPFPPNFKEVVKTIFKKLPELSLKNLSVYILYSKSAVYMSHASCDNKHRSGRSRYWFLTRCRGIELQSFWVCVHAIFGHDTQANLEMSFGCSQTMTLGRD